jgi:hypothetical protein
MLRLPTKIKEIRNNISNSGYTSHILNTGHTHRTLRGTVDVISARETLKHIRKIPIYKLCMGLVVA